MLLIGFVADISINVMNCMPMNVTISSSAFAHLVLSVSLQLGTTEALARIGSLGPGRFHYFFRPKGSFWFLNHRQSTHHSAFDIIDGLHGLTISVLTSCA
jgi:hypothetical protein